MRPRSQPIDAMNLDAGIDHHRLVDIQPTCVAWVARLTGIGPDECLVIPPSLQTLPQLPECSD